MHKAALDADADVADELNATGTPYFFINGRRLVGAQPAERFRTIIDQEEAKAKALVAKGVAPGAVYDELQKQAVLVADATLHIENRYRPRLPRLPMCPR